MTAEAILFGVSCVLLYFAAVIKSREIRLLRALCRRVAYHLAAESHDGIRDIETHGALLVECERVGWTEGGKER